MSPRSSLLVALKLETYSVDPTLARPSGGFSSFTSRALDEHGDEWLFLDDHGALIRPRDLVGCRLGLLPAGMLFGHALAVVDVPHIVFLINPDR
jgi:hypothetical protein